eukprot:7068203-Pyramimonas_sp.AAC.3
MGAGRTGGLGRGRLRVRLCRLNGVRHILTNRLGPASRPRPRSAIQKTTNMLKGMHHRGAGRKRTRGVRDTSELRSSYVPCT